MGAPLWVEAAGWGGALLILFAYSMLTAGRLDAHGRAYQGMNLVGALGFIVNGVWHGAMPSAVLNIVWAGIALYALVRASRGRASRG